MNSVEVPSEIVKLAAFVDQVTAGARQAAVAHKCAVLQQYVDDIATRELGRARGAPKTRQLAEQTSAWRCSRCGSQCKGDFSYSGSYRRTVAFADGVGVIQIPRIRCRCGGNVRPDFGCGLPKRKRHWYDLDLTTVELYAEGLSYRAAARYFARRGSQVGIGSLPSKLAAFCGVDINATVTGQYVHSLTLDGAFWRVGAGSRAQLYVHEVLPRDRPLVRDGKQVAWHRMGKVLACEVAAEETQQAWEQTLNMLGPEGKGLVDDQQPIWTVSDGNQGLLAALDMCLPWSIPQRCCWHIAYRARNLASEANKHSFARDVLWVFNAPDVAQAFGRLERLVEQWLDTEPDAVSSVAAKFDQGVEYLRHPQLAVRPRTTGISERYNQEPKRRFRPMRAFGAIRNMEAMVRLIALRHNCLLDRTDWLRHAAYSVWHTPVPNTTTQQQQRPHPPPYTKQGT